jgi:hypothetical protein
MAGGQNLINSSEYTQAEKEERSMIGEQADGTLKVEKIEPKPQLHVSGLEMLSKCGVQFERVYINRERAIPGVAMLVGTSTHRSVAMNLGNKISAGTLLPLEQIKDAARDTLTNEWQKGVKLDDEEVKEGIAKVKAGAIDKAVRLSTLHALKTAPEISPTHVERQWVVELPGYPVDLAGALDIQEGSAMVRDTKTSGKTPSKTIADESIQLTAYALAVKVIDGKPVEKVQLDYLIDKAQPEAKPFTSTRDDDDFRTLLLRIERAVIAMEKGVFIPARETDWWCSPKYCGFHGSCPFVRQPKQFAA